MKIYILILMLLSLVGCSSSPASESPETNIALYSLVKDACKTQAELHAKGHKLVRFESGAEVFMPPSSKFSMANCIDVGLTSNGVRLSRVLADFGKSAISLGALSNAGRRSSTIVTNTDNRTSSETSITGDDSAKIVTGNGAMIED